MNARRILLGLPYRKIALVLIALILALSWLAPKQPVGAPAEPEIVFMWA